MKVNLIDVGASGGIELPWNSKLVEYMLYFDPVSVESGNEKYFRHKICIDKEPGTKEFYILNLVFS